MTRRGLAAPAALLVPLALAACLGDVPAEVPLYPEPPTVSPASVAMAPGGTQALTITPAKNARSVSAAVFRSVGDSCVARVSATGVVTGVGPGEAGVQILATQDGTTWTLGVPVTVAEPAVLRLTLQSITSGAPPVAVSPTALRGAIVVTANADPSLFEAVELRLAGRTVATQPIATTAAGTVSLAFPVNTALRDAAGQPLYPNGATTLELRGARRAYAPGCLAGSATVTQNVTIANP